MEGNAQVHRDGRACSVPWQVTRSLTCAVLGVDGVAVVTGCADVAVRPSRVVHAAETLARQRVTVGEQHVGVRVAVAMARLTLAAQHHGVAVVTGGTPALGWRREEGKVGLTLRAPHGEISRNFL